jgi:hypothetical protein
MGRSIMPQIQREVNRMTPGTAVIVNLTEQSWTLHRSYGTYQVHGRAPDGPYALTPVHARAAVMDLGDKRTLEVPITASEVAQDLCREINADAGEDSFFGVFVAQAERPGDDELTEARQRLAAFYRSMVASADREWERSHSYLFINDVQRRAARYLGLEKEWFYQARETSDCPGCGEKVRAGVAVCKTCGAILDRDKAATLGLGLVAGRRAGARPPSAHPAGDDAEL